MNMFHVIFGKEIMLPFYPKVGYLNHRYTV